MKRFAVAVVVAGLLVVGIGSAMAGGGQVGDPSHPPPLPGYVNPDGSLGKMPAWLPVADGGWVKSADLMAHPPALVDGLAQQAAIPVYDKPNGKVIGSLSDGTGK